MSAGLETSKPLSSAHLANSLASIFLPRPVGLSGLVIIEPNVCSLANIASIIGIEISDEEAIDNCIYSARPFVECGLILN